MAKQKRYIDETARVFCQVRRKDVDLELCLACHRLVDFDLDARRPYVVCRLAERDDESATVAAAPT